MALRKCILVLVCSMLFGLTLYAQVSKTDKVLDSTWMIDYDELPHFPGGSDSMKSFIKRNAFFPEKYLDVQGVVYVKVLVDTSGELSDFIVLRGLHVKEFEDEAIRVISIMPKWIPAKINGKPVNSKVGLPIIFRLE